MAILTSEAKEMKNKDKKIICLGFSFIVDENITVKEHSSVEDFELYSFEYKGSNILNAYSGNHPSLNRISEIKFDGADMLPSKLKINCKEWSESSQLYTKECLILLNKSFPQYVHIWYQNLTPMERIMADKIINSIDEIDNVE